MNFKMTAAESFSFNGESFGVGGANALRKVKSLADHAPTGRLFASIATLTDISGATSNALEVGQLETASALAQKLLLAGEPKLQNFFRKKA